MSRAIQVCPEEADAILESLKAQLLYGRCYGGAIEVRQTFKKDDRKASLNFTPSAWIKMSALVSDFGTEVQWHGLVQRVAANEFEIYDIIVPPHTVSATTVISDEKEYTEWLNGLDDDTFRDLRFHGHSHVNMAVNPSGVDTGYRSDLITQLPKATENDDVFYIFLIINKSHSWSAEIYDISNNVMYSTVDKDIDLSVVFEDGSLLTEFVNGAKKVAKTAAAAAATSDAAGTKYYSGGYYAGGKWHPYAQQGTDNKKDEKKKGSETVGSAVSKQSTYRDDYDDYYGDYYGDRGYYRGY